MSSTYMGTYCPSQPSLCATKDVTYLAFLGSRKGEDPSGTHKRCRVRSSNCGRSAAVLVLVRSVVAVLLSVFAWTTFSWAMWSLHLPVEPNCRRCCPASFALPLTTRSKALWKSFRNDPGQGSDNGPKLTGLKSESLTGFIPES